MGWLPLIGLGLFVIFFIACYGIIEWIAQFFEDRFFRKQNGAACPQCNSKKTRLVGYSAWRNNEEIWDRSFTHKCLNCNMDFYTKQ